MRIPNRRREQSRKTERRLMTESLGLRNRLTMQRGDSELVEHVRCDGSREVTLNCLPSRRCGTAVPLRCRAQPYLNTATHISPPVSERSSVASVSYTHLRAHETRHDLVCR